MVYVYIFSDATLGILQMTTFVTFYQPVDATTQERDDFYFQRFEELASSGVPIILFLGQRVMDRAPALLEKFANVALQDVIEVPDACEEDHVMPAVRDSQKDTAQYMMIMREKLKYMTRVARLVKTPHLAWIDFGIFKIFKHKDDCAEKLRQIASCEVSRSSETKIYNPGYWDWLVGEIVLDRPCWRFLGGFLFGRKELFQSAYDVQENLYDRYKPVLVWEVNYWALMDDVFEWYFADHNDSMILALPL